MAHRIEEIMSSRNGSTRGLFGVSYATVWRVYLDIAADDFTFNRYPDPAGILEAFIPYGSPHPWNIFATASQFTALEKESPTRFLVEIAYTIPDLSNPGTLQTGWIMSVRGSSITKRKLETIPDGDGNTFAVGARVVTPASGPIEPGSTGLRVQLLKTDDEGGIVEDTVDLIRMKFRKNEGAEVQVPGLLLQLTKIVSAFDATRLPIVTSFYKRTNSVLFLGAPAGHVMFDDFDMTPVATSEFATVAGGVSSDVNIQDGDATVAVRIRTPRRISPPSLDPIIANITGAFRITLSFLYSDEPWDPLKLATEYTDPKSGATGFVEEKQLDGTWIVAQEEFRVIQAKPFSGLFRQLA